MSDREWIAALPSDAIAQVVNAHRDAWEAVASEGKAPNVMRQYEAAAQAFRDALLSLVGAAGGGAPSGPGYAQLEIVGYHITGPEDDYLAAADRSIHISLHRLVQAARGESVDWEVLTAHQRAADGIDLDVFADAITTALPPVKRYRVTLEILDAVASRSTGSEEPPA